MSCFSEDKLPISFENEIQSIESNTIVIRSNIHNLKECNSWISEFGKLTNTKWNSRTSNPCGQKFVCSKKFVCHHSSFMKVPADKNTRSFTKNSSCLASINVKVKLETAATRKKDPFIQKGLLAVITINDAHNHSLNTAEALKFLPAADCRVKFIEYFNSGMGIAESWKYHKRTLELDPKITEMDMANSRINPPYRAVQHWYDEWYLLNLDSRNGDGVIEMSKNLPTYKERINSKREKSSDFVQDTEVSARSQLSDPGDASISIGPDVSPYRPVKKEKNYYPDIRFPCSTTLFPAVGLEEECLPSGTSRMKYKRCVDDEPDSATPKRISMNDFHETNKTSSNDCTIVETPPKVVKIECVDLTDKSQPVIPILCTPVNTNFLENRVPNFHTTFKTKYVYF